MKVLQIVTWYSDYHGETLAAGIFHQEQAEALQPHCETVVWHPFDTTIPNGLTDETEWGIRTFRSRKKGNLAGTIAETLRCFRIINQRFHPNLIHAHVAGQAGFIAMLIGEIYHIPFVVTEHVPVPMMQLDKKMNRQMFSFVYRFSHRNICVSKDLEEKLSDLFPNSHFETVYNGVKDPYKIMGKNKEIKQYRQDDVVNIGITASFYDKEVKGIQFLLPAIYKINTVWGKKVHLHLCGGGEYLQEFINFAAESGVSKDCTFYGACNKRKLYSIISQMDFGVSSSLYESAGVAVEEYLMLGKPMVVTKSGGASSLVSADNAIIVDPGSEDALAAGIAKMCNLYSEYDSGRIRNEALQQFELSYITEKYISIYQQCCKGDDSNQRVRIKGRKNKGN